MIARRRVKVEPTQRRGLRKEPRDIEVLRFNGRAGIIEVDAVADWFWRGTPGAMSAACRRYRRYGEHGLVRVWIRDLREKNRYVLTPRGADWAGLSHAEGQVLRSKVRADTAGADHVVLAAKTWAAIGRRLAEPGSPALVRFVTEGEIRHAVSGNGVLIPDGIAVLGNGGASRCHSVGHCRCVAVEVDLGHERPEVLAAKFAKYRPYVIGRQGFVGLRLDAILIIAPGLSRLARLAMEAERAELGRHCVFLDAKDVGFRTVIDRLATIETLVRAANDGTDPFAVSLLEVVPCS